MVDPTSTEPFGAAKRRLFFGMALVVVRSIQGQPGRIRVTAESGGLSPGTVTMVADVLPKG
ncbi:MAG: hypothetical protein ACP5JJ_19555 [Anaerolineae bacterium]